MYFEIIVHSQSLSFSLLSLECTVLSQHGLNGMCLSQLELMPNSFPTRCFKIDHLLSQRSASNADLKNSSSSSSLKQIYFWFCCPWNFIGWCWFVCLIIPMCSCTVLWVVISGWQPEWLSVLEACSENLDHDLQWNSCCNVGSHYLLIFFNVYLILYYLTWIMKKVH